MKQILTALKGTALVTLISIQFANAQDVAVSNNFAKLNGLPTTEISSKIPAPTVAALVSKRAIKDFARTFKNKVAPEWGLTPSGGYTASFDEANVQNCVYYNKKGNWICNIKRYDEACMSKDIRSLIKPIYYDYTINGVSEVTVPEGTVYLVYLQENATSFKTVRICNGEVDVVEWIQNNKIMKP